jgi:hypothetical protein
MRKLYKSIGIIILALFILDPSAIFAQAKVELTPFAGYQFGGKMKFYEGDLKIQDAANYGLALDFELAPDTKLELFWSQMNTQAEFNPYYNYEYLRIESFDVSVGYIQIGGVQELELDNDMIRPFGAFTFGTTYFIPQETTYDPTWKFSVTLGGGVKIWFSDRVGIRLQGRLMLPMFWGGAGFTVGTGGAGFTVGAGTSMVQGDFTGGLIIGLGN